MWTTRFVLDSLLLFLLINQISCVVQISLVKITKDGTDLSLTPADNPVAAYDIVLGATIVVSCKVTGLGSPEMITPSIPQAQTKRFGDNDERISTVTAGQVLNVTLRDLIAADTGYIYCYNQEDKSESDRLYIFVNDPSNLIIPLSGTGVSVSPPRGSLPCLPTYSTASMTLLMFGRQVPSVVYNTTDGVILVSPSIRNNGPNECKVEVDGLGIKTQRFLVAYSNKLLPPSLVPIGNSYHYLAGQTLELNCTAHTQFVSIFVWRYPAECSVDTAECRESMERVTDTEHRLIDDLKKVEDILRIRQLQENDAGIYSCSYRSTANQEAQSQPVKIYVYARPFVKAVPQEDSLTGIVNGEITLYVTIDSMPTATVTWSFDGQTIEDNGKYVIKEMPKYARNGTSYVVSLTVKTLELSDTGTYECQAEVQGAKAIALMSLEVQAPPMLEAIYMVDGNTFYIANNTDPVYLVPDTQVTQTCEATAGKPPPAIDWYWQSCPLNTPNCPPEPDQKAWKRITASSSSLDSPNMAFISNNGPAIKTLKSNAMKPGWYRCSVKNVIGQVSTSILSVPSEVEPVGIDFLKESRRQAGDLVQDDMLLLKCYSSSIHCTSSNIQINKLSDNSELWNKNNAFNFSQSSSGTGYVLTVKLTNITLTMNGYEFDCGCNGFPRKKVVLSVQPYVQPSWVTSVSENKTSMTVGTDRMFTCLPIGRPLPQVTWYKDGDKVVNSSTFLLSSDSTNLTVRKATPSDSGEYSCVAETNRPGDVMSVNFSLIIATPATGESINSEQIAMIVCILVIVMVIAVIATVFLVRKFCRKKYTPHELLLPSKEMINPDIPIDEQTDALPYDAGWEFPSGNLKLGMLLGQGAFGRVLKGEAMNIEEGVAITTVAVKTVRDNHDIEQIKALISELKILIHIGQHLNIVNLLGACTKDLSKGTIMVIVEYCRYGNLRAYILKHKSGFKPTYENFAMDSRDSVKLGRVSIDMADDSYLDPGTSDIHSEERPLTCRDLLCWSFQIARGMEYLATIGYIHRDLAARNVLLAEDNIVKIADFGMAKDVFKYQEYKKKTDGPLPIKWMALESLTHKVFNTTTDVWAYGVTIWELFSLAATPYPGVEIDESFIDKLQDGYRMDQPQYATTDLYNVMLTCWHPDPGMRPTFDELAEQVGSMLQSDIRDHYLELEDPYWRMLDSRADFVRKNPGRKRDLSDFDSDYLPVSTASHPNGGTKPQTNDYYNTSPSVSQPMNKKWNKEPATKDEKLPLQVSLDDSAEDMDMPSGMAPSPSPWERQSRHGKLAAYGDDSHSFKSIDSDGARPPSYNYVMKKKDRTTPEPAQLKVDMNHSKESLSSNTSYQETSI